MNIEEKCISFLDTAYSCELARRMEREKTNPVLGYRTAGSRAEAATGDMLLEEMRAIGLEAEKDAFVLDGWEFEKAVLKFQGADGEPHTCQMGAYQTNFETEGFQELELVYLGKGTAADYEGIDVRGKLVLVEMNQRDEWWISFPVYQAYLKGAAALIAVQSQGYGEVDPRALNAQDIAGPEYAPAFSLSQADAALLKQAIAAEAARRSESARRSEFGLLGREERAVCGSAKEAESGELKGMAVRVSLDARSRVERDRISYNIVGKLPGTGSDRMILLSAHYDSYFDGFQDDNTAVAMMLGIARALVQGGYRPVHTLVFCAMAAEEWGIIDSKYDWSTGAYRQVFQVHPEWQGRVLADLNFELPAHAHNTRDAVRCTYEYAEFIKRFTERLEVPKEAYPDGITVLYPIETWSDDFSMAIAGIPSMVNDFSAGPFMETHYHSQYDTQDFYQESVYRFHHECYLRLLLAFDALALPPMDFGKMLRALAGTLNGAAGRTGDGERRELRLLLERAAKRADNVYRSIGEANRRYEALSEGMERGELLRKLEDTQQRLYRLFRKTQDYFVRLNWHDEVIFPQEAAQNNIRELSGAVEALKRGEIRAALTALYRVDNNRYAFEFDEEVYYHFTEYILHQPADRLMWGAGRIMHHENLYGIVQTLKKRLTESGPQGGHMLEEEIRRLEAALRRQTAYYIDDLRYLSRAVQKTDGMLEEILNGLKRFLDMR